VSNPGNQTNKATANKLIKYLITHKHWSPMEMVDATFEIEVPRDIGRQMLRHRSFSFQEFSQRYAESLGFAAPREARMQDPTNRQSSLPCPDDVLNEEWFRRQMSVIEFCEGHYQWALDKGIAKECARVVLPEGLTLSRMYMKGSLRSWIHYLEVRCDPSTQKEHREIAQGIAQVIHEVFGIV
jgi:thymidylate synthase (FAD)